MKKDRIRSFGDKSGNDNENAEQGGYSVGEAEKVREQLFDTGTRRLGDTVSNKITPRLRVMKASWKKGAFHET